MADPIVCSQCGEALPDDWEKPQAEGGEPVCTNCALKHFKRKSQRRKVITTLLDMYDIDANDEEIDQSAKKDAGKKDAGKKSEGEDSSNSST